MIISTCSETLNLASNSHNDTFQIGVALIATLYHKNSFIALSGELGAGKTTLTQGMAKGLGIDESIVSPTYAIENRYGDTLLHMDLYRLDSKEAHRIAEASAGFPGVRVVEWFDRLTRDWSERLSSNKQGQHVLEENIITIAITERSASERSIAITFNDIAFPDRARIEAWRNDMKLPHHIGKHCDAVAALAKKLGEELLRRGKPVRLMALERAAELHDLLRFIDFKPDVQKKIPHARKEDAETQSHWDRIKKQYPVSHEAACALFMTEQGYPEIGTIIRSHGLHAITDAPESIQTIEQKLLFYADKRVKFDTEVSVDERFDEFIERYGNGVESEWAKIARGRTKELEKELFENAIP